MISFKNNSFSGNIFKSYILRVVAIFTGFLSMLMVLPKLASRPDLYAVYTFCMSLTIFFSYADFGFISAGQKYASEFFIQKNTNKELQVISFVICFLTIFILISSSILIYISYNPETLFKGGTENQLKVTSKLILILALSFPNVILQRVNYLFYSIRLQDYIYQGIDVLFNLFKIFSISLFIGENSYDIVGYFFLLQILTFISAFFGVLIGFFKYNYSITFFIKSFRISHEMFKLTKSLALSSLFTTVAWILYYELDAVLIGKIYGIRTVAIYAVAFTLISLFRTLYNAMFGPFQTRLNHLVGLGDLNQLNSYFLKLVLITLPICVIPPLVVATYIDSILPIWIGNQYSSSIQVTKIFMYSFIFGSLSIPLTYYITAKEKNKYIRLSSLLLPLIFSSSLIAFDRIVGINSLAWAKLLTSVLSFLLIFYFSNVVYGFAFLKSYLNAIFKLSVALISFFILYNFYPSINVISNTKTCSYIQLAIKLSPLIVIPLLLYYFLFFRKMLATIFNINNNK